VIRLAFLAAVVLLVASACGGSTSETHGGSGTVSADGQVGALRIDSSTRADIGRFAGRPDVNVVDHTSWPGVPEYRALGYGCEDGDSVGVDTGGESGHRFCRTVYYVNSQTDRLVAFWTDSRDFRTTNGIRPGMPQKAADRREHQTPHGPWKAIGEASSTADLILPSYLGKVEEFMLESRHHPIGLTFT
jgi:hypothetical protein